MPRSTPRTDPAAHRPNAEDSTSELQFDDARVLLALCGPRNENLPVLEREARVDASVRGHTLLLAGEPADVALAERYLVEAGALAEQGVVVEPADVGRALQVLRSDPEVRLKRDLWDGLLREAYGEEVGEDSLFLQHTYLAIVVNEKVRARQQSIETRAD